MKKIVILLITFLIFSAVFVSGCSKQSPQPSPPPPTTPGIYVVPETMQVITQPTPDQSSYLTIETIPSGATVEVGVKTINGIVTFGTGRIVGVTPLTVKLYPTDVSVYNTYASLGISITKQGYIPNYQIIDLDQYGQLEKGKTYQLSVKLKSP